MNFKDAQFKAQAIRNFQDAKEILDALKIPFFLSNGTLLGCIRENDVIAHDSDIDLGIFIEDLQGRQEEIKKAFIEKGFHIFGVFGTPEDGYEISLKRKAKLDLFFYYHEGDKDTMSVVGNGNQRKKYIYPKIHAQMTKTFLGELVFIPYDYEGYLSAQYGEWRIPQEEWCYFNSPKNLNG